MYSISPSTACSRRCIDSNKWATPEGAALVKAVDVTISLGFSITSLSNVARTSFFHWLVRSKRLRFRFRETIILRFRISNLQMSGIIRGSPVELTTWVNNSGSVPTRPPIKPSLLKHMLFQLGGLVIPMPSIPLSPALLMLPFTLRCLILTLILIQTRQKLPKKICWQMHLGTFVMALIHQFVGEGTTLCWPKTTWSSDTMLNCWTLKFELFSVLLSLDSILFTYSLCLEPFVMAFLGGRTSSTRSK